MFITFEFKFKSNSKDDFKKFELNTKMYNCYLNYDAKKSMIGSITYKGIKLNNVLLLKKNYPQNF